MSGWAGSHSRGFPARTRRTILDTHPYCTCGQPATEADHLVPVSMGGTNDLSNGRGMCHACHQAKTQAEAAAGRASRPQRTRTPEQHPGINHTQ